MGKAPSQKIFLNLAKNIGPALSGEKIEGDPKNTRFLMLREVCIPSHFVTDPVQNLEAVDLAQVHLLYTQIVALAMPGSVILYLCPKLCISLVQKCTIRIEQIATFAVSQVINGPSERF